jgi:putative transcriptional regulator
MVADTPGYDVRVREVRERVGLSQEALARQCGVSRQAIVNIERGESQPRVLLAIAIGAALGVAIGEIFGGATNP